MRHVVRYAFLMAILLLFCERGWAFASFEHETSFPASLLQEQWNLGWTFVVFDDESDMVVTAPRVKWFGFAEMPFGIAEATIIGCAGLAGYYGGLALGGAGAAGGAVTGAVVCHFAGVKLEEFLEEASDSESSDQSPWYECDGVLLGIGGYPVCVSDTP